MKKFLLFGAIVFLCAAVCAQSASDEKEAVIIDATAIPGTLRDEVKVFNLTHESNITVTVSTFQEKTERWELYGTVNLKDPGAAKKVKSRWRGVLKKYSHFAIATNVKEPVTITATKQNHDLYVYIVSDATMNAEAYVVDSMLIAGAFTDEIKLKNESADAGIGFDVFGRKTEIDSWQKIGLAYLKVAPDEDEVYSILKEPVTNFRFFGVVPHNGKKYRYNTAKMPSDLYIFVK